MCETEYNYNAAVMINQFWWEVGAAAVAKNLKRKQLNRRMRAAGMRVIKGGKP